MTMSKLANLGFMPAAHFSRGRNGQTVRKITPHYMSGNLSCESCLDCWINRDASANYGIDSDGNIACYVLEENRAWTSSSTSNDRQAITIVVANLDNTTGKISDKAWQSLVKLCTDICYRYKFKLNFTNDSSGSLTMHKMFADTSCPGPWIESHMDELADTVNNNLVTNNFNYRSTPSSSNSSNGLVISDPAIAYAAGIEGRILFDQEEIYPYVISIDEKTSSYIDIDKLKNADIVRACIDMGSYYTENHQVSDVFRNSKLDEQFKLFKNANMAVGLSTTLRSRNKEEALKELYEIRLTTLKYPPNMGIWLKPTFYSKNKKTNDALIRIYYDALIKLGFIDQVGFYCKKEELEKFNWEDVCEDWYWWMDRHLNSVDKIHNLPLPRFFFYDNPGDEECLIEPDFAGWAQLKAEYRSRIFGNLTGGYTDYQKAVADAAESGRGSFILNMCAQYVTEVYTQARSVKPDIEIPYGNAIDYWDKWKNSGGTDRNPPVGSVVVGSGRSSMGAKYGHVGVVCFDGKIAENVGRHKINKDLDAWESGMIQNNRGQTGYIGWVWPNNQDLSKMGTMIGGISINGVSGTKVTTIDGVTMKLPVDWGYAHRSQSDFNGANWNGSDNVRGIGIFNCNEEGDGSSAYANSYAINVRWEYVWYTNVYGKWPSHARYTGTSKSTGIQVGGVSDGIGSIRSFSNFDLNSYVNALGEAKILCVNPDTGKGCVCASGFYALGRAEHNWGGNPLALLGGITTAISNAIGAQQNQSVLELYWVDSSTKLGPI